MNYKKLKFYFIFYFRWTSDSALSEVGTVQIEMRDLSRASGDKKYEVISKELIDKIN